MGRIPAENGNLSRFLSLTVHLLERPGTKTIDADTLLSCAPYR
jgi:hypothetical protein